MDLHEPIRWCTWETARGCMRTDQIQDLCTPYIVREWKIQIDNDVFKNRTTILGHPHDLKRRLQRRSPWPHQESTQRVFKLRLINVTTLGIQPESVQVQIGLRDHIRSLPRECSSWDCSVGPHYESTERMFKLRLVHVITLGVYPESVQVQIGLRDHTRSPPRECWSWDWSMGAH